MSSSRSSFGFLLVALLAIVTLGAGCGGSSTTDSNSNSNKTASMTKTYTNSAKKFSFEYPSTWTLREGKELAGSDAQVIAPAVNDFSPNITMKSDVADLSLPQWSTPENLSKSLQEGYKKLIPGFQFLSSESTAVAGYTAVKFTFVSSNPESGLKAVSSQYWIVIPAGRYYLIETLRPQDNTALYDAEFNTILASFKISE